MPPPLSPTLPRKGGRERTAGVANISSLRSEAIQDHGKTARGAQDCCASPAKKKTPPYGDGGVFFGAQQTLRARSGRFT
jgi:hypothetical protein